MAKFRK